MLGFLQIPQKVLGCPETFETFEENIKRLQESAAKLKEEHPEEPLDDVVISVDLRWREFKERSEKLRSNIQEIAEHQDEYVEKMKMLVQWVDTVERMMQDLNGVKDYNECTELMRKFQV